MSTDLLFHNKVTRRRLIVGGLASMLALTLPIAVGCGGGGSGGGSDDSSPNTDIAGRTVVNVSWTKDATGTEAMSKALVTITQNGNGVATQTVSRSSSQAIFESLPTGRYIVEITATNQAGTIVQRAAAPLTIAESQGSLLQVAVDAPVAHIELTVNGDLPAEPMALRFGATYDIVAAYRSKSGALVPLPETHQRVTVGDGLVGIGQKDSAPFVNTPVVHAQVRAVRDGQITARVGGGAASSAPEVAVGYTVPTPVFSASEVAAVQSGPGSDANGDGNAVSADRDFYAVMHSSRWGLNYTPPEDGITMGVFYALSIFAPREGGSDELRAYYEYPRVPISAELPGGANAEVLGMALLTPVNADATTPRTLYVLRRFELWAVNDSYRLDMLTWEPGSQTLTLVRSIPGNFTALVPGSSHNHAYVAVRGGGFNILEPDGTMAPIPLREPTLLAPTTGSDGSQGEEQDYSSSYNLVGVDDAEAMRTTPADFLSHARFYFRGFNGPLTRARITGAKDSIYKPGLVFKKGFVAATGDTVYRIAQGDFSAPRHLVEVLDKTGQPAARLELPNPEGADLDYIAYGLENFGPTPGQGSFLTLKGNHRLRKAIVTRFTQTQ